MNLNESHAHKRKVMIIIMSCYLFVLAKYFASMIFSYLFVFVWPIRAQFVMKIFNPHDSF
jgi:hypothetical protein